MRFDLFPASVFRKRRQKEWIHFLERVISFPFALMISRRARGESPPGSAL